MTRSLVLSALVAALSLTEGPAHARVEPDRGAKPDARASKKGSVEQPAPDRKKKRGKDDTADEDAPPLTSYQIELQIQKRETAIEADRKRGIALLEEFIDKHAASRAMPEALYRLAALYWERSQEQFLSSMEHWAEKVDACKEDPEACGEGPPPEPMLDLTASQAIYERLLRDYPTFRKTDTVRYLYGFSLRDQGRIDEAQAQFWAIIQQHPNSTFIPDAWLAVGDHRFYKDSNFSTALEAYDHILDYPQSDAYAMALFKTAWCHWKLGQREDAIVRFKQVLDQAASEEQDEAGRKRLADLREEALEYLVQIISEDETQTPKGIYDFLASIGGSQYSRKVLVRLGEAYEAQTRYDKSVPTWRFLIELDANHPDNADFQIHVFTGIRGLAKTTEALDSLGVLHAKYNPRSEWGKAHPEEARKANVRGEKLLYDFARSIHESAQLHEKDTKVPDKDRYGLAARAYEDYIGRFPANPHSVELSYLSGDIYFFKLEQLEKAGDAYLRVGESAPVGPTHRDALLAAISAYEEVIARGPSAPAPAPKPEANRPPPEEPAEAGAPPPDGAGDEAGPPPEVGDETPADEKAPAPTVASPYSPPEQKFIRAIDLFAALFPEDDEIGVVVYKLGEFFYGRDDFDAAVQRFGKVVVEYPDSANAGAAGDRILESLNQARDYDNIELWAQKLKGAKSFQSDQEQNRLDRIIVDSLLKQGETLAGRGYYARSANYYLRVANEYPRDDKAAVALNNAGAALERADKASAATEVYKRLADDYAKTPEGAKAALIVARVYENIARYDRAATEYDRLIERYPKHEARAEALYNAGILYQALGDDKKAIDRYDDYARQYSSRDDAVDVELRVGQVHAEAGNHRAAVSAFESFEKRHPRHARVIEARTRRGNSLLAQDKVKAADKAYAAAVKAARSAEGRALIFGAEARYMQGDLIFRRFEAAKLDSKPSKLKSSLERKAKLLGEAKDAYLDVLSFRSAEWSTAALYRVGASYEQFATSLREYPIPKGLTPEQEDAYMEQLDTFALMFEEQAIESYKSGYQKAMDLKIYNSHTQKIRDALGRLSSQEFPPISEIGAELVVAEGGGRGGRAVRRLSR